MKKFLAMALAAVMVLALAACGSKNDNSADTNTDGSNTETTLSGTVSTDGSTSMEKVINSLGESFMAMNKDVKFTYNPTGSGSGIQAVSEGRCDIGLSSRALKDDEKASGLVETVVALDGIAIVVNPENPVSDLDIDTIAKIYTGEITNWKAATTPRSCSSAVRPAPARVTASSPSPTPRTPASTVRSSPPRATSSTPCPRTPTPSAMPLSPRSATASRR